MENLGRGVVAIRTSATDVYVGWRLLATDPPDTAFNLYRTTGGAAPVLLNAAPLAATTDFVDTTADLGRANAYRVAPIVGGVEQAASAPFTLPASAATNQYLSIPLVPPPGGLTPIGEAYGYTANDASVGDLDGDGEYEIVLKWEPTNAHDNSQDGYTGNVYLDAYQLSGNRLWRIDLGRNIRAGAHYTQFIVYDLDGDGKAEVAAKTADATVDGVGAVIGDAAADYRNLVGRILDGPEFLTVFNGQTGAAQATVNYNPPRGDVCLWGNDSGGRPECYGNRVDRFLAAVAYLDGKRPSLVMCRGYYDRSVLAAWNWREGALTPLWTFDTHDGTPGNLAYAGQGNHNLSVADVDQDGKQEIVYGAMVVDDDGKGLYSTGWRHGDALHVSDMDPDRPGLEVFMPHENPSIAGAEFRDARSGELIWGVPTSDDNGRGLALDIDPTRPGFEYWTGLGVGLRDRAGALISSSTPPINFGVFWDADPLRELLDGTTISKWDWTANRTVPLLSPPGVSSNNGTKATPALSADILGDWREEVIWRASNNRELRLYTTTIPAENRIFTLMQDPQYRAAVAWQNVAYNQPPHPGFYLGHGMMPPVAPNIVTDPNAPATPAVPVIHAVLTDTGISATDRVTADPTLSLTGLADAGALVTVYEVGVGALGTTSADAAGSWTFDHTGTALPSGNHYFTATADDGSGAASGSLPAVQIVVDTTAPAVVASNRMSPVAEATSATSVTYQVIFSERVAGLVPAAFALVPTGTVNGIITAVSAVLGTVVNVTVSSITGQGTLRLDVNPAGPLQDIAGNPLAGGFAAGQIYAFVTPTWIRPLPGGLWSDPANWLAGLVGGGVGLAANFNTLDIASDNTVYLDGPRTVGNLIFGDVNPATPASWIVDPAGDPGNGLNLAVFAGSPAVTVNAMGTGAGATIRASLSSTAGFTKAGPGVLTLAGPNTLAGTTAITGGTLRVGEGATLSPTAVNIAAGGARLSVAGGSFAAAGTVNINAGGGSGVYVDSGTAVFNTITSNNTSGAVVRIAGGTVTAATITFPRTSDGVPNYATGLVVTGGVTTVGTIGLGTNNSYGVMSVEGGSLTASGMISVGNLGSNSNRGGALRVTGGTFTSTDAASGIVMTQRNNNTSIATFSGGTSTVEKITLGLDANVLSGVATIDLAGGALYLGAGGLVKNGVGTFAANVNLASGILGARTNWTTALNLNLPAANTITLMAADAGGMPHDMSLGGVLGGAGGFTKAGAGRLTLTGANTYAGDTTVAAGNLQVDGILGPAAGIVTVNGGTLAGLGSVARPVVVNTGSVAPGTAAQNGVLQVAALTWNGGQIALDLGAASDTLTVAGALLKGSAGSHLLMLQAPGVLPVGATYTLITFAATDFTAADLAVSPPPDHEGVLTVDAGSVRFTITKHDAAPPVLDLPASLVLEATGPAGAVAAFAATATDAVDGDVAVSYSHTPGSVFPLGTTSVTVTATDLSGNRATGSFTVTVRDTTPPDLSVPADQVVEATGPAGALATFTAAATDLVDGNLPVVFSPASGSVFAIGVTMVQVTATDRASNASSGSFRVTVRDATAPRFLELKATPDTLWPADGEMKRVRIHARVADAVDRRPHTRIVSVASDEPSRRDPNGCDGPPRHRPRGCPEADWEITGDLTLKLRAERDSRGDGRVYTITVESRDDAGNVATRTTTVKVPKHRPH